MKDKYYQFPLKKSFQKKMVFLIPIFNDNYVFVIVNHKNQGLIIDPGASREVLEFLENMKITPVALLITHSHPDHIGGVKEIQAQFPQMISLDFQHRKGLQEVNRFGFSFEIMDSPGHLPDHIMFYESEESWLFCGDVLFRYGCGRIFTGTYEEFFTSLNQIKLLKDETQVFCTHEYTKKNLEFCIQKNLLPEPSALQEMLEEAEQIPTIPFSLGKEKQVNPFLKTKTVEEFKNLRILRNSF